MLMVAAKKGRPLSDQGFQSYDHKKLNSIPRTGLEADLTPEFLDDTSAWLIPWFQSRFWAENSAMCAKHLTNRIVSK